MALIAKKLAAKKLTALSTGGGPVEGAVMSVNHITPDEAGDVELGSIVNSVDGIGPNDAGNVVLSNSDIDIMFQTWTAMTNWLGGLPSIVNGMMKITFNGPSFSQTDPNLDLRFIGGGIIDIDFEGLDLTQCIQPFLDIKMGEVPVILRNLKLYSIHDNSSSVELERKLVLDEVVFVSRPIDFALPNVPNLDITILQSCDMSGITGSNGGLFSVAEGSDLIIHLDPAKLPARTLFRTEASPFCLGSGHIQFTRTSSSDYLLTDTFDGTNPYVDMLSGSVVMQDGREYGIKAASGYEDITIECATVAALKVLLDGLPLQINKNYIFHLTNAAAIQESNVNLTILGYIRGGTGSVRVYADNFAICRNIEINAAVPVFFDKISPYQDTASTPNRANVRRHSSIEFDYPMQVEFRNILTFMPSVIPNFAHGYHILNAIGRLTNVYLEYVDISSIDTPGPKTQGPTMRLTADGANITVARAWERMMISDDNVKTSLKAINSGVINISQRDSTANTELSIKTGGRMFLGVAESPTVQILEEILL
jgi:hypothetical protein